MIAASAAFPLGRLLVATAATAVALLTLWSGLYMSGLVSESTYKAVILGLIAAAGSHAMANFIGAGIASISSVAFAPKQATIHAYLASTTVRFIATPALAVSLYFLLPQKPVPLLLGAVAAHLIIMVVDIATLLKALPGRAGPSAPNA